MTPQEMFWDILCKKIEIIQKLPDDILIDIISEMSEPLRVLNYDFKFNEEVVEVNIPTMSGSDMTLTLFSKSNYNWVNQNACESLGNQLSYVEAMVDEELESRLSFKQELVVCEVLCTDNRYNK